MKKHIHVVGAGLAGSEVCWQLLNKGHAVTLYEMRPKVMTPAHNTGDFAELVCSNSLKSKDPISAPGLLKNEMRLLNSLTLQAADYAQVPAGQALAVDRKKFSTFIEENLRSQKEFTFCNEEIHALPGANEGIWVLATGPLTGSHLATDLEKITSRLYFYDAIAPVVAADSIDYSQTFFADRYDKGDKDYLNVPLDKELYQKVVQELLDAEKMPLHAFEEPKYFEACLPLEVLAERGLNTLRFGPFKPVGLTDPKTGRYPYAVIQLRQETTQGTMLSLVGCQTKMKWPEQKRVFSLIPAFKDIEFLRYGSVHRNSYVDSPNLLALDFSLKTRNNVFLAGQILGVEGYTESAAMGILVGRAVAARLGGENFVLPKPDTVIGALANYVLMGTKGPFSPMNANFGILDISSLSNLGASKLTKQDRKNRLATIANHSIHEYLN